ncbi:hypothetical protein C3L33_10083, partial [Rhododendron williamsianum]
MDWDVDRMLFSMTFDDFFTNDDVVFKIKDWLSQNKPLLKNGQLFDARCAAHVLKSIALDSVEALHDVTHKVRESIRRCCSLLYDHRDFENYDDLEDEEASNSSGDHHGLSLYSIPAVDEKDMVVLKDSNFSEFIERNRRRCFSICA